MKYLVLFFVLLLCAAPAYAGPGCAKRCKCLDCGTGCKCVPGKFCDGPGCNCAPITALRDTMMAAIVPRQAAPQNPRADALRQAMLAGMGSVPSPVRPSPVRPAPAMPWRTPGVGPLMPGGMCPGGVCPPGR